MSRSFKIILIIFGILTAGEIIWMVGSKYYYSLNTLEKQKIESKVGPALGPILHAITFPIGFFDDCTKYRTDKCKPWCNIERGTSCGSGWNDCFDSGQSCANSKYSLRSLINEYKNKKIEAAKEQEKIKEQGKCAKYSQTNCLSDNNCHLKLVSSGSFSGMPSNADFNFYCVEKTADEKRRVKDYRLSCIESGGEWKTNGDMGTVVLSQYCQCPENLKLDRERCRPFTEEEISHKQKCLETGGYWIEPPKEWCSCPNESPDRTNVEKQKSYLENGGLVFASRDRGCITEKQRCIEQSKQWLPKKYELIAYPQKGGKNYQDCATKGGRLYDEYICWIISTDKWGCVEK
ncbi:MAG: hypothetical protein Q8M83_03205 [bacterium]|nr:hypothetical protein [bacterium]